MHARIRSFALAAVALSAVASTACKKKPVVALAPVPVVVPFNKDSADAADAARRAAAAAKAAADKAAADKVAADLAAKNAAAVAAARAAFAPPGYSRGLPPLPAIFRGVPLRLRPARFFY